MHQLNSDHVRRAAGGVWRRFLLFGTGVAVLFVWGCSREQAPSGGDQRPAGLVAVTLQATPNPVPSGSNATTVTWDAGTGKTAQLFVSQSDGPEKLVSEGRKGSKEIKWIGKGNYEFRLYAGKEHESKLATVVVIGTTPAPKTLEQKQ
jgi:hypothetical protein